MVGRNVTKLIKGANDERAEPFAPRDYNRDGIGTVGQARDGHKCDLDKQIARKGGRKDIDRDMTPGNVLDGC